MTLQPGTRVRVTRGPLGVVVHDQPYRFVEGRHIQRGYETDVSDVPCSTPGWVYLNTDDDELVAPVSEAHVEVLKGAKP